MTSSDDLQRGVPVLFYAESFAPWCERSRWALDHHQVPYREIAQVPLVAELSLRLALRKPLRRVTVPLLVHGEVALMDSNRVARYAEQIGAGPTLFPAAYQAEIESWMRYSEQLMTSGRALLLPRLARNVSALGEQLPRFVPTSVRPLLRWIARAGVRHLMRKYATAERDVGWHEGQCREALSKLRESVIREGEFLVGAAFTYADATMAAALQFVLPVEEKYISLERATREAWTHHELADEFRDVLAWRDAIYAAHRK